MNLTKSKVDDDWVWEIANSTRWLSQHFKEKFKIEKFLFGDIYATYHQILPDFVISLMEELGYDKEDNTDTDDNAQSCSSVAPSTTGSPLATPIKSSPVKNVQQLISNSITANFNSSSSSQQNPIINNFINQSYLREDSNSNCSNLTFVGGFNSLFEDLSQTNCNSQSGFNGNTNNNNNSIFNDSNENDDNNNTTITNTFANDNSDDLLDEFKKKKTYAINVFCCF